MSSVSSLLAKLSILLNVVLLCVLLMVWKSAMLSHIVKSYGGKERQTHEQTRKNFLIKNFFSIFEKTNLSSTEDQQYQNSLEHKMYPDMKNCYSRPVTQKYYQKGDYWILENYIPRDLGFRCDQSITYTTHSDYTLLDNLIPLTSRWNGPVSIAVYAPGTDFPAAIDTILYIRNCISEGVKKYVTFHLFFHLNHVPKKIPTTNNILQRKIDCNKNSRKRSKIKTYRRKKMLFYPINVARNVAKENSITYFNFPSDIELYPSINVIPEFFKMLKKPDTSNSTNPRVYVFPIFEIAKNKKVPETKVELQALLRMKKAIPFHKYICSFCHKQPRGKEWQRTNASSGLSVFHISKRNRPFHRWEPLYIGTNKEPIFDERLSWEGRRDKMTQMYIMCVRDYEFHILNNAFLIHKPGIKRTKPKRTDKRVAKQYYIFRHKIYPEYRTIFGTRKNCYM